LSFTGAGERALGVPEELTLEQRLGQRAAVDRGERPLAARGALVDPARHDLLAGAALAGDEHGAVGRRDRLGQSQRLTPGARAAGRRHHAATIATLDLLGQALVLGAQRARLERAAHDRHQLVVAERLLEVVERAIVDGLDGALQRRLRRHQHHGEAGVQRPRRGEQLQPVHAGHAHVADDDVGTQLREPLQPGAAALGDVGGEAFGLEEDAHGVEDRRLVVHDQDHGLVGAVHRGISGRRAPTGCTG
jgi:hypothetical protein